MNSIHQRFTVGPQWANMMTALSMFKIKHYHYHKALSCIMDVLWRWLWLWKCIGRTSIFKSQSNYKVQQWGLWWLLVAGRVQAEAGSWGIAGVVHGLVRLLSLLCSLSQPPRSGKSWLIPAVFKVISFPLVQLQGPEGHLCISSVSLRP